jgi:hypothetical protein
VLILEKSPFPPTIKQVDHLMVQVPEPERIFQLFTEGLGLPVAWPMVDYGPFKSGGVSFGNVNMEVLNSSEEMRKEGVIPRGTGIVGIAFQPSEHLESTVKVLDAGTVPHGPVLPFSVEQDGTPMTLWKNLELTGMIPGSLVFYCEYTFRDQGGFRQRMEQTLAAAKGGALGITGLKEITIEYADPAVLKKWHKILPEAAGRTPEMLDGGNGIIINLEKSGLNRISSITLKVKSLEQAQKALVDKGFHGSISEGQISISPGAIAGLQVYLTG